MALAGRAALAMWWDIAPQVRADFEHWHAHQHFPERLAIPGFLRASRWRGADGGDGTFVLYELADHAVLQSPAYLARLNAPTAWSTRLMPQHRHMVRSQCHVLESRGGVIARCALTVRLTAADGRETDLRSGLRRLCESMPLWPGIAGMHLLRHEGPPIAATTEQHLRGLADGAADWVLIVSAYDRDTLATRVADTFDAPGLAAMGAAPSAARGLFELAYAAMATDVTDISLPAGDSAAP